MSFWDKIWDSENKTDLKTDLQEKQLDSLEDALECSWSYTQDKLFCFNLPYPEIVEKGVPDTACINMLDQQIKVNRQFVEYLKARGVQYETSLRGILCHEAGHHKIIPWDLKNMLLMLYTAGKVSQKHKDAITNYFADICLNLDLIIKKQEDSVRKIYGAMEKSSNVDNLICNLYQFKTGMDFNASPLDKKMEARLTALKKIKFTSQKRIYPNLRKFAAVLKDVLDEEEASGKKHARGGQESYSIADIDKFDVSTYDPNAVRKALNEIAGDAESPQKFREIYRFVKKLAKEKGIGNNTALSNPAELSDKAASLIDFYSVKADQYSISVTEKSILCGGDSGRSELKAWEIDESTATVDIFNSYGLFFPGITKSWVDSADEGCREMKATPDLMIMIDSSGSMPDPEQELSCACLGSICAAKHYLKKGRQVAVANFSDSTRITPFTSDFNLVAKGILQYQNGGTQLKDSAYSEIARHGKEVDILLLSDGYISDLQSVLARLEARANTNRISLVQIDRGFGWAGGFSGYNGSGKLKAYCVKDEKDIPMLVVEDMAGGM